MRQWIGPGNQIASYDTENGKLNRFSCHFLWSLMPFPSLSIPMANPQAIMFKNEKRNDSSWPGGSLSSWMSCLHLLNFCSWLYSHHTMITELCVSRSIQYAMDYNYDCVCLCFWMGSEGQSASIARREPPPKSSAKFTIPWVFNVSVEEKF